MNNIKKFFITIILNNFFSIKYFFTENIDHYNVFNTVTQKHKEYINGVGKKKQDDEKKNKQKRQKMTKFRYFIFKNQAIVYFLSMVGPAFCLLIFGIWICRRKDKKLVDEKNKFIESLLLTGVIINNKVISYSTPHPQQIINIYNLTE